jgi:predicted Zn-dependent protease
LRKLVQKVFDGVRGIGMFETMPKVRHHVRRSALLGLSALIAFAPIGPAQAAGISLVRDAETEKLIRDYSTPIWRAAGLVPSAVHVHLVLDPNINAFVTAGQRMFINTGLITQADAPMELIGVIAHETGHMAGGHLSRSSEAYGKFALPYYASLIAGLGAIAAGAGDAGMAILAGGAQVTQRSVLAYTRQQEGSADQAGATYLERARESGKGMLMLFERFRDQEALSTTSQDPFVQSHPISEERLASLEERVKASPYYDVPDTPESIHAFKMVQAKINGYVDSPEVTLRRYPVSDQSDYGHYARAVAYHKGDSDSKAHAELEPLLKKYPNDPFLWELKGQIDFESGRVDASIPSYRKAHDLMPNEPQLDLALGQALLATDQKSVAREAADLLKSAVKGDPENPFGHYQLSIAYARLGDIGMAELSTAQYYEAVGAKRDAVGHAEKAQTLLKEGSPEWLRAQDIVIANKPSRDK